MKKSINAWTIDEKADFEKMFGDVREAGFEGIELNIDKDGHSNHSLSLEKGSDLDGIAKLSQKYSLPVVSISTSLGGSTSTRGEGFQKAHKLIRRQIECAKALGAKLILSVPGGVGDRVSGGDKASVAGEVSIRDAYKNSLDCYREIGDEIASSSIMVCLEQVWNGFFTSAFDMAKFIDDLDNPSIAAYFDVGNMLAFSWPEYWIEILGKRICLLHVKDFKRNGSFNRGGDFVDLMAGSARWKEVVAALRAAGFDGYLTAEVEKRDDQTYDEFYRETAGIIGKIINM